MRVLLTGASGFLGRYVLAQLTQQGIDAVVVGRSRPVRHGGDFIEADLLQKDDCSAIVQRARATHLMHLAWYAEHGKYWASALNLRWLETSVRLIEAFCSAGGQKVVAAGTCAEYDWSCGYCREDITPLAPASMYGTAEDAARGFMRLLLSDATGKAAPSGRADSNPPRPRAVSPAPARCVPSGTCCDGASGNTEFLRQKCAPSSVPARVSLAELRGGLEDSATFAGSPLSIQEKMRREWN